MTTRYTVSVAICLVVAGLVGWFVWWRAPGGSEPFDNKRVEYTLHTAPYSLARGAELLYVAGDDSPARGRPFRVVMKSEDSVGDLVITDTSIDLNGDRAGMTYYKALKDFVRVVFDDPARSDITFSRTREAPGVLTVGYRDSPVGTVTGDGGVYTIALTNHETITALAPFVAGGVVLYDTVAGGKK